MSTNGPRRTAALVAAAVALVLFATIRSDTLVADAASPSAAVQSAGAPAVIDVAGSAGSTVIPAGFLGLSLEYWSVEAYAGHDPRAINPLLVRLIRSLTPAQTAVLRIGGGSTDGTWWSVPRAASPGLTYTLTPNRLAVMKELAREVNGRFILGINLEANSTRLAGAEARAEVAQIGRAQIDALELGNEPELYATRGWYQTRSGRSVPGRPANYGFPAFAKDLVRFHTALPPLPLAGPSTGARDLLSHLSALIASEPRIRLATLHNYPFQACFFPPGPRRYPTTAQLLSRASSVGLAAGVAPYVAVAHANHVALRIDETNAFACGFDPGVSGTFATALWALDALFAEAQAGVDGVNLHTYPGFGSQLFTFRRVKSRWQAFVEPEYYGLLAFARAAPAGSRLVQVSGATGGVRAWATLAPDGQTRVTLINTDMQAHAVRMRIDGAVDAATLELLRGPNVHATSGVTLAGQSFGPQTYTGELAGPHRATLIVPDHGDYVVRVPATSAALLTLR